MSRKKRTNTIAAITKRMQEEEKKKEKVRDPKVKLTAKSSGKPWSAEAINALREHEQEAIYKANEKGNYNLDITATNDMRKKAAEKFIGRSSGSIRSKLSTIRDSSSSISNFISDDSATKQLNNKDNHDFQPLDYDQKRRLYTLLRWDLEQGRSPIEAYQGKKKNAMPEDAVLVRIQHLYRSNYEHITRQQIKEALSELLVYNAKDELIDVKQPDKPEEKQFQKLQYK